MPPPRAAPAGLAVLDGRRGVRGGLRAARHRAAALPPPRRLLHQEPRVRHLARATRARLRAAGRPARRASAARWRGIARPDGCERHAPGFRAAQDAAVRRRHVGAREKYQRWSSAGPGWGALLSTSWCNSSRSACPARSGWRCARRCIRCCSAPAAATSSSARTSCCAIRTRSTSATTWSIDDNCLLDAKGDDATRASRIGSGVFIGRNTILSCKNGDIELDDGANIGFNCEIFSASRVRVGRETLLAALLLPDRRRPRLQRSRRARCSSRAARRPASTIGDGRVARRRREDPRRRDDRRSRGRRRRRGRARVGAGRRDRRRRARRGSSAHASERRAAVSRRMSEPAAS